MWITISGYIYSLLQLNRSICPSIQTCTFINLVRFLFSRACWSVAHNIGPGDTEEGRASLRKCFKYSPRSVVGVIGEGEEEETLLWANVDERLSILWPSCVSPQTTPPPPLLLKMKFSWWHNVVTSDVGREHDDIKNYYYYYLTERRLWVLVY